MGHKQADTIKGFANHRWFKMQERVAKHPCYSHVKIHFSKLEFIEWVAKNWSHVITLREKGETPSIDRLNPKGDYIFHNLRIISMRENRAAGLKERNRLRKEKLRLANPPKKCPVCKMIYDKKPREAWTEFKVRKYCSARCKILMRQRDKKGRVI